MSESLLLSLSSWEGHVADGVPVRSATALSGFAPTSKYHSVLSVISCFFQLLDQDHIPSPGMPGLQNLLSYLNQLGLFPYNA